MRSQHWFRKWLDAIRQQAITWTNVDPELRCHMVSLGHNELNLLEGNALQSKKEQTPIPVLWLLFAISSHENSDIHQHFSVEIK